MCNGQQMSIYVSVGGANLSWMSYLCALPSVNRRFSINFSEVCVGAGRQRVCKAVMFHSFYQRVLRKQWVLSRYRLHGSWIIYATTQNIHQKVETQGVGCRLRLSRIGMCFKYVAHVKPGDVTVMFFSPTLQGQLLLLVLSDAAELHKHQHVGSIHTLAGLLTRQQQLCGTPCSSSAGGAVHWRENYPKHIPPTWVWHPLKRKSNQPMKRLRVQSEDRAEKGVKT